MKKIRLDHDELRVESFPTTPGSVRNGGTVFGRGTGYPYDTCVGLGCGSGGPSCGCGLTPGCLWTDESCQGTCNCGLTYTCGTGDATDCPGDTQCAPWTQGSTCEASCTDVQGCTACGAVC